MSENRRPFNTMVGLATVGSSLTGVIGLLGVLISFFSGEYLSAGIFLIAAALAFGLLAIAILHS